MRHVFLLIGLMACDDAAAPSRVDVTASDADGRSPEVDDTTGVSPLCPVPCSDFDGPCMRGVCTIVGCRQQRLTGQQCDDGRACTTGDRCVHGMCAGDASACEPGITCGEVTCPGEDARCDDEGHCTRCSLAIENADCEPPTYPRLTCPNMPAGMRVRAELRGAVRDTGSIFTNNLGLSWAEASWGDAATGWCTEFPSFTLGLPDQCGTSLNQRRRDWDPTLERERLVFTAETVGALVAARPFDANPLTNTFGPLCEAMDLGGAILSIEVVP